MSRSFIILFTMLAAIFCVSAGLVHAELSLGDLRTKFEAALEREKLEKGTKLLKLRDGYIGALERLKTALGREEKLVQATQVLTEIEAIKAAGVIVPLPDNAEYRLKSLRSKWDRETGVINENHKVNIRKLANTYLKALEERKRSFTRAGEIREALAVEEEVERVGKIEIVVKALATGDSWGTLRGKYGEGNVALATKGSKAVAPNDADQLIDGVVDDYRSRGRYAWGEIPCEFSVKLPKLHVVNRIRLLLYDADSRRYKYLVEVSVDGKNWTIVEDHKARSVAAGWQDSVFEPRDVRFVRVKGYGNTVNENFHIIELEIYSPAR